MAINNVINVTEGTALYDDLYNMVDNANDDDLVIVAKGELNRKNDRIKPLTVKNGIYFYIAMELNGALAYLTKYTPEQVCKAKQNTIRKARFGVMPTLDDDPVAFFNQEWKPLDEIKYFSPMNILSNAKRTNGAGILLCPEYFEEIKEKIGDFYILPSSIHELIIVPDDGSFEKDGLSYMVREINRNEVSEYEILADCAFNADEWI